MSTPPPAPDRPRFSLEDAAGLLLALVFGLASFVYPFGRDQGLYYYVGREWALRGNIPYRDVFDHKTPGIYVLHALAVKVFGEVMWGIRVIDLLGVVATAFVVAWLAAAPGKPIAKGAVGRAALFTPWLVVLARCITPHGERGASHDAWDSWSSDESRQSWRNSIAAVRTTCEGAPPNSSRR